ncbi:exonuclease domain-containing protein [Subsaxibacter sp. CAU 1640]|uniref:exonuclease domain-containing protein n=1 Tax=Subsaxibacter sp. CAU 1640 TaxID=2933271 RepID=UPI0020061D66|nr:exonuclease domain-containing protein [Subsaxibacter sp. CAU 1640]MCK7589270.1 exonuclease domain-containing protein [Subsaxibacter sp. CAU 1640]
MAKTKVIYTIIDVETTGRGNKITEISIFKHDGEQVIDEFTSLVNPEALIPDYITALTGIDNAMVANAPTFSDIAQDILDITKDSIFVAHNVNFDYNVIRNEFKAIDIDFRRKKLCTVRLSRSLFPGFRSYSLGKLCNSLNIDLVDRHRARGDAEATTILFEQILAHQYSKKTIASFLKKNSKEATLPPHLESQVFNDIPNAPGIYYFKNKKGKIIYVGKAINLKKRVLGHFYDKSDKELNLCRETADIDFELSGSDLIARLMEDAAIKHHFPIYNRAAKRPPKPYAIFSYEDRRGVIHLAFNTLKATPNPLQVFHSIRDCRLYLEQICEQFELCPKYCHLQESVWTCSHYKLTNCKGVCRDEESVMNYNERVNLALNHIHSSNENLILKEKGRNIEEEAFILIKNGAYLGYGFIEKSEQIVHSIDLERFLIPQKETAETNGILKSALITHKNRVQLETYSDTE